MPDTTAPGTTAPDQIKPDRGQWAQDALAPLVANGTISQSQADAVIAALEAARPEGGPGFGHGFGHGADLEAAATAIGITEDELRTALQSGQSLAEIAQAHGVTPQAVIDALVADAKADVRGAGDQRRHHPGRSRSEAGRAGRPHHRDGER